MYCEKCQLFSDSLMYPACGNRRLRMPREDDWCFLVEKEFM